jgi:hypothetical protein
MSGSIHTRKGKRFEEAPPVTDTPTDRSRFSLDEVITARDHRDLVRQVADLVDERLWLPDSDDIAVPNGWPASGRFRLSVRLEPAQ